MGNVGRTDKEHDRLGLLYFFLFDGYRSALHDKIHYVFAVPVMHERFV